MSAARRLVTAASDCAKASLAAGVGFAVALAATGGIRSGHFVALAALEHWLALAPIALAVTGGAALAQLGLARLHGLARWAAAGAAALAAGAFAARHDPAIEALQRVLPPLGDALARGGAFVTTQPKPAVLACVVLAAAFALARAIRRAPPSRVATALALVAFAAAPLALHLARAQASPPHAKSVLLVVLDTVAARHLASAGYGRDTMPELEALAKRGVRFPNAFSAAPWTVPSHASMFTGLAPIAHGATQENVALAERHATLAEILRAHGFRTFAAAGNTVVGPFSRLDQGFAQFLPTWRRDVVAATRGASHPNNGAFVRFLAGVPERERFFAFVNYIDAHSPYAPPSPHDRRWGALPRRPVEQSWQHYYTGKSALGSLDFQELADLYDGELEKLSRDLADLIGALERAGRLRDTVVIVTAHHGENLGDHQHLDHVFNLYDSLLHVPLFAIGGGVPVGVVDPRPATSVDVFATVLAAAGIPRESLAGAGFDVAGLRFEGQDLLAPAAPRGELVHEYYFPNQALSAIEPADLAGAEKRIAPYLRRLRAPRGADGWKLIWASNGRHELYDLAADPDERANRAAGEVARVTKMMQRLEARLAEQTGKAFRFNDEARPRQSAGFEGLDDETRKNLESLGYVK